MTLNAAIALTSLAVAMWFGPIEVIEYVVSAEVTISSISINFDPVFLVWDEGNSIPGAAFSIGSTIVMEERWRGTDREAYLLHHEMNHVRQCQALEWAMWPAHWFEVLEIEGRAQAIDWDNPEQSDEYMWIPEEGPNWYHFMSLSLKFGG